MRRFTRYVLFELLKVFFIALAGMTLLMILVGVGQQAVRQNLGPLPTLRLIPFILPDALRFAVPGTMLFAACSVYGRMSAANEVVAIKSLGISPTAIISPALVLSFVISLVAVWLNDVAVSWGRENIQRVIVHSIEEIAYSMLRSHRSYSTPRFSINVADVQGRTLIRPTLSVQPAEDGSQLILTAREAELRFDSERESLRVLLTDVEADLGASARAGFPNETFEYEVSLAAASVKGAETASPSDYALRQITPAMEEAREQVEALEQSMAAEAAFQLMIGDFQGLAAPQWSKRHSVYEENRSRLHRLATEPWRRWANGFSCFFFVLVGAPLAIRLRNADLWTSFGFCFLPILLVYYPLLMYGVDRAKVGDLPPYAVWLGNVILLAAGLWLIRRVGRY